MSEKEFDDRRLADEYLFEMTERELKQLAKVLNLNYPRLKLRAELARQRIFEEEAEDTREFPPPTN